MLMRKYWGVSIIQIIIEYESIIAEVEPDTSGIIHYRAVLYSVIVRFP